MKNLHLFITLDFLFDETLIETYESVLNYPRVEGIPSYSKHQWNQFPTGNKNEIISIVKLH